MTRLKSIPLAIGGLVLMAGTVAAFTALPDAAAPGLLKATNASGKTVPVRDVPVDVPAVVAPAVAPEEAPAVDLPDAAAHGAAVSAVATAEDTLGVPKEFIQDSTVPGVHPDQQPLTGV